MRTPLILLSSLALAASSHALDFTATFDPTATPQQTAAIQAAMGAWSSRLTNDAHVSVAFVADPSLVGTSATSHYDSQVDYLPYADYRAALASHATSALDATAVSYLQATTTGSFGYLINGSNQDNGDTHPSSSDTLEVNNALEKALGIVPSDTTDPDFTVYYNPSATGYDYDQGDGIGAGLRDFTGAIETQLGQGLGFATELNSLDDSYEQGFDDKDAVGLQTPLDLFRFQDFDGTPTRSWTAGTEAKYFTVDGGATRLGNFHTGIEHGDGYAMASFTESGTVFSRPLLVGSVNRISALDLQAMDAIGWNLAAPVPEPAPLAALAIGALALLRRRARR